MDAWISKSRTPAYTHFEGLSAASVRTEALACGERFRIQARDTSAHQSLLREASGRPVLALVDGSAPLKKALTGA